MKKFVREFCFGKNSKITALLVLFVIAFIVIGCSSFRKQLEDISDNGKTNNPTPFGTSTPYTTSTPPATQTGDLPSNSEVESLVKATMSDFADAVDRGDFTNFHSRTSKDFQATYTPSQLRTTFQVFIDKRDQVLPSLRGVDATSASFTDGPRIRTEKGYKILVANGQFPTRPYATRFETEYELEKGAWKILKITVRM